MIFFWLTIFIIAVTDAREHRIPNNYLLVLLAIVFLIKFSSPAEHHQLLAAVYGGVICFSVSLSGYLLRFMAAGDVKLLGVVGFAVGWGQLLNFTFALSISAIVVGGFYAAQQWAQQPNLARQLCEKYRLLIYGGAKVQQLLLSPEELHKKARMPFAPIVVIGLALQQYLY